MPDFGAATICLQRTPITLGAQHVQGPNLEPISSKGTVINIHQEVANAFLTLHWMRSLFTLVSMIKLHRCTSLITSSCFSLGKTGKNCSRKIFFIYRCHLSEILFFFVTFDLYFFVSLFFFICYYLRVLTSFQVNDSYSRRTETFLCVLTC